MSRNNQAWEMRRDISERVTKLEEDVSHISDGLDSLRGETQAGFRDLFKAIRDQNERSRITWPLIFTAVGTLIGVLGLVGIIGSMSLRPLQMEIDNIKAGVAHSSTALKHDIADHVGTVRRECELRQVVTETKAQLWDSQNKPTLPTH